MDGSVKILNLGITPLALRLYALNLEFEGCKITGYLRLSLGEKQGSREETGYYLGIKKMRCGQGCRGKID